MFLLLLIGLPILEIAVAIWVASEIGWLNTIGLLILLSIIGLWVVKRQGMGIVMTLQETAQRREKPANSLMDRFLILFGGVLLVIPGFVTAAVGLLLFLPPVRAGLRGMAAARVEKKVSTGRWAVRHGRRLRAGCRLHRGPPRPKAAAESASGPSRDREPLTWSKSVMRPP